MERSSKAELTPWNELRVALAEMKDARSYVEHMRRTADVGGLVLFALAFERAIDSVERACAAIAPPDANND